MRTQFEWGVVVLEEPAELELPTVVSLEARLLKGKDGELRLMVKHAGDNNSWCWLLSLSPHDGRLQLLRGGFARGESLGQHFHLAGLARQIATSIERRDG